MKRGDEIVGLDSVAASAREDVADEQGLRQGTGGQRSRNGIVVFPINRRMVVIRLGRNDNVRSGKIGTEGAQQFGDANKADGMEDVRVGELMQCGCICLCGFGRACIHNFHIF